MRERDLSRYCAWETRVLCQRAGTLKGTLEPLIFVMGTIADHDKSARDRRDPAAQAASTGVMCNLF
jgi:hypothetical protein